nr:hypothetical protein [uncultured Sphingosinicella sp.]
MNEGEPRNGQERPGDGDSYLYDFFKYLTSVSLVSLGAIFTFLQMEKISGVSDLAVAGAVVSLGLSAFMAFMGAERLVSAKAAGRAIEPGVYRLRTIAPRAYLLGLGILAFICGDVLF